MPKRGAVQRAKRELAIAQAQAKVDDAEEAVAKYVGKDPVKSAAARVAAEEAKVELSKAKRKGRKTTGKRKRKGLLGWL